MSEALWDLAQKRFKENSEKFNREEARAREEDVLAMIEDGLSRAEIAEYLGINIEKVKYTVQKLVKEGRLKEEPMEERGIVGLNLITGAEGFLPEFYERHGFKKENRVILMGMEL